MARGNDRQPVFFGDGDREVFLDVLARVATVMRWRVHAWVLMSNHYHLLLETPEPNLSRGMRQLNGLYTQRINARHGRTGHVLQGRFKGILVERESHLVELCRYLVLNPVRARLVSSAAQWPWSSYRATAGLAPAPSWLETGWTLEQFAPARRDAIRAFRRFVAEGTGSDYAPWDAVEGQLYLGREGFRAGLQGRGAGLAQAAEIPKAQRAVVRPTRQAVVDEVLREFGLAAEELTNRRNGEARKMLAWICRNEGGFGLGEVAPVLGVTVWAVSRLESGGEALRLVDARFRGRLESVVARLSAESNESARKVRPRAARKSRNKT